MKIHIIIDEESGKFPDRDKLLALNEFFIRSAQSLPTKSAIAIRTLLKSIQEKENCMYIPIAALREDLQEALGAVIHEALAENFRMEVRTDL